MNVIESRSFIEVRIAQFVLPCQVLMIMSSKRSSAAEAFFCLLAVLDVQDGVNTPPGRGFGEARAASGQTARPAAADRLGAMIYLLRFLFAAILIAMLAVTITASLDRGVFEAAADLWSDLWFRATLADAYFGFITVYVWIAYKEPGWGRRLLWFVLLMGFGNIAIAVYLLIQLSRLRPGDPIEKLLLREGSR